MNRRQRRRRRQLLRAAVLGPMWTVVGLLGLGLLLPSRHQESALRRYYSSPEAVFAVLTDLEAMPTWRRDLGNVERLPGRSGLVVWREWDRRGRTTAMERTESTPNSRIVVAPAGAASQSFRWTYDLRPVTGGTELAITEEQIIRNPIGRALVLMFGADRDRVEGWAEDLEVRLNGRRERLAAAGGHR